MYFFKLIFICIAIVIYQFPKVSAQQCDCSCGYIAATSVSIQDSCPQVGDVMPVKPRVIWDDGLFSEGYIEFVTQSVVGSCCTFINMFANGSGFVTAGLFAGEPITATNALQDSKPKCLSCQTKSQIGVSELSGIAFSEIGTPGTGNWRRCKGIIKFYYSPPLTSVLQPLTLTYELRFTQCTNCTDACK